MLIYSLTATPCQAESLGFSNYSEYLLSEHEPKLQATITREKAPIYTMGSPDVRAYSRNKRGIAGSLIWVNFDRHALLNLFWQAGATFLADADEIRPQYQNGEMPARSFIFVDPRSRSLDRLDHRPVDPRLSLPSAQTSEEVAPWYSDQVLPFDVTLAGANEYGAMAWPRSSASRS